MAERNTTKKKRKKKSDPAAPHSQRPAVMRMVSTITSTGSKSRDSMTRSGKCINTRLDARSRTTLEAMAWMLAPRP